MKIMVLNESPKERSDIMVLTNAFLDGMQPTKHEVTYVRIAEKEH